MWEASEAPDPSAKFFVGQLPYSRTEQDIFEAFGQHGAVAEVVLLRDNQGQKKGAAFVKFFTFESAEAALALDGHFFEGATRPIAVSFANSGDSGATKRRRM